MAQDESQQLQRYLTPISLAVASEIDLEIGLREKITQALNARIAWAVLLKESLQHGARSHPTGHESFKYAAFDALKVAEKPTDILLEKGEPAPPNLRLLETLRTARAAPKTKFQLPRNAKTAFLYIRSSTLVNSDRNGDDQSEFYILKCPVCSRTTFTALQGLLNHARISHSLEWGTHEECIQACAVVDASINVESGIEVGVGATGILPGLRTIFRRAVEPSLVNNVSGHAQSSTEDERSGEPETASSHLTKTLGLHKDTPALAPFLGKEPIRRGIKVYSQDNFLDVDSLDGNVSFASARPKIWRHRFAQRGSAPQIEYDEISGSPRAVGEDTVSISNYRGRGGDAPGSNVGAPMPLGAVATRFHFSTRIIITDRSLSVDPGRDGKKMQFTHKWMLTVDAPSYAHNVAAILRSMRVTPLSTPGAVRCPRPQADEPPFVIVGTASQPFLAGVELVFNEVEGKDPDGEGQAFSLEHWVDLDPLRCPAAVIGDEQICDIELDKNTIIKPVNFEHAPINYRALWELVDESDSSQQDPIYEPGHRATKAPYSESQVVLNSLLPNFPLTLKDLRRRRGLKAVSYRLVADEAQFSALVEGRRKAIEWGRIRALRDAYNEVAQQRVPKLPELTSAGIHGWLRTEGHSLYPGGPVKSTPNLEKDGLMPVCHGNLHSRWCALCGLDLGLHLFPGSVQAGEREFQDDIPEFIGNTVMDSNCRIVPKDSYTLQLLPINVGRLGKILLPTRGVRGQVHNPVSIPDHLDGKDVVSLADPHVIMAVRHLVHQLRLPSFENGTNLVSSCPLDHLGQTPGEIEATLAPYGLLAMCLGPFIRRVVSSGLAVAMQQRALAGPHTSSRELPKEGLEQETNTLLSPAHILTGIRSRGRGAEAGTDGVDKAVLLCLSGLGTPFISREGSRGSLPDGATAIKEEHV